MDTKGLEGLSVLGSDILGVSVPRVDGLSKVTGAQQFGGDIVRPAMLWGKVLRSPIPHGLIKHIQTGKARSLPGLRCVLTGQDLPDVRVGRAFRDMPVLARDRVRFVGEKVAAVAAEDLESAEEAISLINVEYEELRAVLDVRSATLPDAPLLHPELPTIAREGQQLPPVRNGLSQFTWGAPTQELELAFSGAARIFEHTFSIATQHQGYIEPHATLVEVARDGKVHIWGSYKSPFLLRLYLMEGLGLPYERFEFHPLAVGGDFGGKGSPMDVPICYFLATTTERPVKMIMSYAEEMMAGNPRHPAEAWLRTGVDDGGCLVARHIRVIYDSGAYGAFKVTDNVHLPTAHLAGLYASEVCRLETVLVYTNSIPRGHMRNPGGPQALVASEAQIELIARELGMDPLEFRVRNLPREGETAWSGGRYKNVRAREALMAVAEALEWGQPKRPSTGRGLALVEQATSPGTYSVELVIRTDGRAVVRSPVMDVGPGTHTVLRQLVAAELSFPLERVEVIPWVQTITYDTGSGGSRVTRLAGEAARQAARRIRERLTLAAAEALGVAPDRVTVEDAVFEAEGRKLDCGEVVRFAGGEFIEQHTHQVGREDTVHAFSAIGAEIEVDVETGAIQVSRLVSGHDTGVVINPALAEGQIQGAVSQGLGAAMMEELVLENGKPVTLSLADYKIPCAQDAPPLSIVFLEPDMSAGIKPIGEGPNCGAAAAVVNAVIDATGPGIAATPLTAESVLAAVRHGSLGSPPSSSG